jgi:hypothetical protein
MEFSSGYDTEVRIPFKKNGFAQSPFSDDAGKVYPIGIYQHDFAEKFPDLILRNRSSNSPITPPSEGLWSFNQNKDNIYFNTNDYDIPPELLGQPVQWHVPSHMAGNMDGLWVEQCLGGIVDPMILIGVEDNFGGVRDVWISSKQFNVTAPFEGCDQNVPSTL